MDFQLLKGEAGSDQVTGEKKHQVSKTTKLLGVAMGITAAATCVMVMRTGKTSPVVVLPAETTCAASACLSDGEADAGCCTYFSKASCVHGYTNFIGESCSRFGFKVKTCCVADSGDLGREVAELESEVAQLKADLGVKINATDRKVDELKEEFESITPAPGPAGPRGPQGPPGATGAPGPAAPENEMQQREAEAACRALNSGENWVFAVQQPSVHRTCTEVCSALPGVVSSRLHCVNMLALGGEPAPPEQKGLNEYKYGAHLCGTKNGNFCCCQDQYR